MKTSTKQSFLIPRFAKPGVHMLRAADNLEDVARVVRAARADPEKTSRVGAAASALAEERLSDHACLCAIHSNLKSQRRMQRKGRSQRGVRSSKDTSNSGASVQYTTKTVITSQSVTARGIELIRERWHRDFGTAIVVRTRGVPVWWALFGSVLCFTLSWWRIHYFISLGTSP